MGSLKIFEAFFEPFLGFIRYMPASAFIPLFILWLGIGESEKVAVIFFGTFFQMTLMVMDVTKNVSQELIDTSYTLGVSKRSVFRRIILPASMPGIMDTLRITFRLGLDLSGGGGDRSSQLRTGIHDHAVAAFSQNSEYYRRYSGDRRDRHHHRPSSSSGCISGCIRGWAKEERPDGAQSLH